MSLLIHAFTLGPLENNTYLLADSWTHAAVIIDPSYEIQRVLKFAQANQFNIQAIWLTHAHFDHIIGVDEAARAFQPPLPVGLHPDDLPLWKQGGGGALFGFPTRVTVQPSLLFADKQSVQVGECRLEVRHTPGHTPGHVVFYEADSGVVFCGDVIFRGSIGRTDLPGASTQALLASIRREILPLPPETRLLSGHGEETTVGEEIASNPFL
ncbi:MAG TPA: MBL fold metallo-hydrolase [Anaerolineaceae bacterium]